MIGHLVTGSKRLARAIHFRIQLYKLASVVVWRILRGRWHVFRDAPDWFVEICAEAKSTNDPSDDFSNEVLRQAAAEWRLRCRRNPLDPPQPPANNQD